MKKQENITKRGKRTTIGIVIIFAAVIFVFLVGYMFGAYLNYRNHWNVTSNVVAFTESSKQINNPNRGFYSLYGFVISDEEQDYKQQLGQKMYDDQQSLALIEINLRNYREGSISKEGLCNIEKLFEALKEEQKQYLVRFLYDWNGKAKETEPKDAVIILNHMEQVKVIMNAYEDCIFLFQGIFVGDCGEMHGSHHMDENTMKLLMNQMLENMPPNCFFSVRTPQQWRILTGISKETALSSTKLAQRLGLFNDGIMGTELDTGTYGNVSKKESGAFGKWTREEELLFQNELCKNVPNGGEIIIDNPMNDFENAVESLSQMHITYLSRDYDQEVLQKWENYIVKESDVFCNMDGLSYIERHLGYRLLISDVNMKYSFWPSDLTIVTRFRNEGFAPIYYDPVCGLVVRNRETGESTYFPLQTELCDLAGGTDFEKLLEVEQTISLAGYEAGEYDIYFRINDSKTGYSLVLANEQEATEFGYLLGSIEVGAIINPFNGESLKTGKEIGLRLEEWKNKNEATGN